MNVMALFPQVVCSDRLNTKLSKKELSFIEKQDKATNIGNLTSVNKYLLEEPQLTSLKDSLMACVREYFFNVLNYDANAVDIHMTQSWANYTLPKHYHHTHWHGNSIVSGVFYVHGEGDADKITFYKESPFLQIMPTAVHVMNAENWSFPVNTGDLFLFPSTLQHGVSPTESENTRISIAFNTFIRGKIGSLNNLTELVL